MTESQLRQARAEMRRVCVGVLRVRNILADDLEWFGFISPRICSDNGAKTFHLTTIFRTRMAAIGNGTRFQNPFMKNSAKAAFCRVVKYDCGSRIDVRFSFRRYRFA